MGLAYRNPFCNCHVSLTFQPLCLFLVDSSFFFESQAIALPFVWRSLIAFFPYDGNRSRAALFFSTSYLVDPASSHMLVSKIKPCMSKYKRVYCETAKGSLNQL